MGFFDWVMHGLGFENTEKKEKKDKKDKTEQEKDDKYANFNLHEKVDGEAMGAKEMENNNYNAFNIQTESNIIILTPKNFQDIRQVVNYLRQGQSVGVNLQDIEDQDRSRILDFLSGAIYGLNGSIHRWYGDLFILAPEGRKILKKE